MYLAEPDWIVISLKFGVSTSIGLSNTKIRIKVKIKELNCGGLESLMKSVRNCSQVKSCTSIYCQLIHEIFTVIIHAVGLVVLLDCNVYPSVESKSDCKVIPFALNATVDTTSEKVRANMDASRFTSKVSQL